MVEYFLSRGASANVPTFSGNTPLHTAAGRQMQEMIKLLSRHGADVNVANLEGDKPKVVQGSEQVSPQSLQKYTSGLMYCHLMNVENWISLFFRFSTADESIFLVQKLFFYFSFPFIIVSG